MRRTINLLAWAAVALVAGLSALNWSTLRAAAPLDLVVAQVQAPLGVVMLAMAAVLVALFVIAYLRHQVVSMLETRKLLKEVQRVQSLADGAEASRIDSLRRAMVDEFRQLNERLAALTVHSPPIAPMWTPRDPTAAPVAAPQQAHPS